MTLQQLKYIIALDKERHFSKAAEECMVSQPGLTIQLKNLEEEIGVKIFDRNKVPLKPTILGEQIINKAKKIMREVDEMQNLIISEKNTLAGNINLGVIITLSPYIVPDFIQKMREIAPQLHLTIKEGSTLSLMNDLEAGIIDIALMATPTGKKNLREFHVFNEPFIAFLHADHPAANEPLYKMTDIGANSLLLLHDEYCYNAQMLAICDIDYTNESSNYSYDIRTIETLKNLVRANLGFAIIPELSILHELPNPLFKKFMDPQPVREISLVVNDSFSRKLLLEKMSQVIWNNLPENLKTAFPYKKIKWNDSPYFFKSISNK
ncbi:hydrogen peroxide-inducible genes activator [Olivibacter domesticus]|uniref:LysR family transcriptional regulator, hydrogen peroxide-inducible genes activator n=1 Tax=Olivibacter domesticus TaxID=407022 RepID=A0A1H7M1V6_OLID1|nr:hydrogen peroxide-inducible genes activator [Olivibacter domesticus]SEL04587.1 LysR family transcriptional regulator, hydrogen peroxide-inducible genes activator [Olivibacter domesticus]